MILWKKKKGTFKVYDITTKKVLSEGDFCVSTNENKELDKILLMYSDKSFLVIEWEINNHKFYNHYLCGMPGFDFSDYKKWLHEFRNICK